MSFIFVDSEVSLQTALALLKRTHTVAVDCEGEVLSRTGRLCVLAFATLKGDSMLIDVVALPDAFTITDGSGFSLQALLEDEAITKVMCDPRCDSDALYHQFGGIHLKGVICVQLMEVASRRLKGRTAPHCFGLGKIFEQYLPSSTSSEEQERRKQIVSRFTSRGGDPTLWSQRPLDKDLFWYASSDIGKMITLYGILHPQVTVKLGAVKKMSQFRVDYCLEPVPYQKDAVAPDF